MTKCVKRKPGPIWRRIEETEGQKEIVIEKIEREAVIVIVI